MKKKITAIFLCIALAATAIVGASLAYFTDTKSATNTFTVGNVKIDLQEGTKKETGETAADLTDWDTTYPNGAQLMPGTQTDGNAVSKIVTVKNTSDNAAWVWVDIKVPTVLVSEDIQGASKETFNALHWNSYGHFTTANNASGKYKASAIADGIIDNDGNVINSDMVAVDKGLWNDFKYIGKTKDGYTIFRATMEKTLAGNTISLPCLRQVYMDWRIIADDNGDYIFPETTTDNHHYDGTTIPADTDWNIVVNAYAIQADGFDTVDKAIEAYETQTKANANA